MEHSIDYIYVNGKHYDRMFGGGDNDFAFWKDQARHYGSPILELACGTGRISSVLAQEGFEVVGIDNADGMLSEAIKKPGGTAVEWINADMCNFDIGRLFNLIILPANALCHLLNLADFEACLSSVKRHLAPNGRFIIDVFVPKAEALLNRPGRFPFSEYDDPDGRGRVVVTESTVYETDTQIRRIKVFSSVPGMDNEIEGALNMRMYFPQELDALIKYNGFAIDAKYGNYDLAPFAADSPKQLVICSIAD